VQPAIQFGAELIAPYKKVRALEIVEEIPVLGQGACGSRGARPIGVRGTLNGGILCNPGVVAVTIITWPKTSHTSSWLRTARRRRRGC
jgi:hypothetical protein